MARSLHWAVLSGLSVVAFLSMLPSACRILADIPGGDPYVDASPGGWDGEAPVSPLCKSYCEKAKSNCKGQLYPTDTNCQAVCGVLPEGEPGDVSGNSVQCRLNAITTRDTTECQVASPMSDKDGTCGDRCQNYCYLLKALCPGDFMESFGDEEVCGATCRGLAMLDNYSATSPDDTNTLQCRFYHLSSSAEKPEVHCGHAVGKGGHCLSPEGGMADMNPPDSGAPDTGVNDSGVVKDASTKDSSTSTDGGG